MKKAITFLLSFFIFSTLFAQVVYQEAVARELNSNRTPINGVFVKFEDAGSANSDDKGNFRLAFQDKKAGDIIFLEDIKKSGYELVNKKDFEVTNISNTLQLSADVILAKTGVLDAAKKEYYGVSDQALLAGVEKEKNRLKAKLKSAQLDQQEYLQQLQILQEQYDRQQKSLDALAAKFARVNFDDVEPIYQEALELFKSGKVTEAIATLEGANPSQRTAKIIEEEKRIAGAQAELDTQKAQLATDKKKQIAAIRLLADMYNVNFNPEKAEDQYDQLLLLDSTSLEILQEVADFYQEQHLYDKAKKTYQKIIVHPQVEAQQIADAHKNMGKLYNATGNSIDALNAFETSFEIYQELHTKNPSILFYKVGLNTVYQNLGITYTSLGNLDAALNYHEKELEFAKELYEAYPKNMDYKFNLATAYQDLGLTHSWLGNLDAALNYHEKRLELAKELYEAYPKSMKFKNTLAVSYQYLGFTYTSLGNLDTAIQYYENFNQLEKELYEAYPKNVKVKWELAVSYEHLGTVHTLLRNLDTALNYYEKELELFKELNEAYPQNAAFKNGLAIVYEKIGKVLISQSNFQQALAYFEKDLILTKEVFEDDPQNVNYKFGLAYVRAMLGVTHHSLGNLPTAVENFIECIRLGNELYEAYPKNVSFKNGLAAWYTKLGNTYNSIGDFTKALTCFEKDFTLTKELYETYPQDVKFKFGLASVHSNLGTFYKEKLKEKKKARNYFQNAQKLLVELMRDSPLNVGYQEELNMVREALTKLE